MQINRRFTAAGKSPYEKIPFRRATSEIKNPDGSVVFRLENFAVPEHWSQVAADILAHLQQCRDRVSAAGLSDQVEARDRVLRLERIERRHHHLDLDRPLAIMVAAR